MKSKAAYIYGIVLLIGIIILVNIVASKFYLRGDMTEDNRYTLSNATEEIVQNLDQPVTITAYFSEEIPAKLRKTKRQFKDLLVEYVNVSDGKVNYQFIDPGKDKKTQQKVIRKEGIRPAVVNVRKKDKREQQRVFMGAVIRKGDKKEVIPFVKPKMSTEYIISSKIRKLSAQKKPFIGFLQGHGEPSLRKMKEVKSSLNVLYKPEEVTLSDTATMLSKYNTLAIVAPKDSFPKSHLKQLDNFLKRGGNLLVAMNRVKGNFRRARGKENTTGLETWLKEKGIEISPSFIVDANCGMVSVRQRQGFNAQINFPYLPIISNFKEHPITKGLEAVSMEFASPMKYTGDSSLTYKPLTLTSKKTGIQKAPLRFNIRKSWSEDDFPESKITVGGLLEGNIVGNRKSQMVVISDGDFAVNLRKKQKKDNVNLFVNSLDYLANGSGLMEIRTKGITSRPLEQIKDSKKAFLKYFNFLMPIVIIILFGIFRFQHKRMLRVKRMEVDYV